MAVEIPEDALKKMLLRRDDWSPFPTAADREAWDRLLSKPVNQKRLEALTALAQQTLSEPIPIVLATEWLQFTRTGARTPMQRPFGQKRQMLSVLALAELMECKGRFLDGLVNVLWNICEESGWNMSAHNAGRALPDVTDPIPDLAATGTALTLAELDYLLGEQMEDVAPGVRDRIRCEVDQRVLKPYLASDDHWWLGFTGRGVNNWNAVCNAGAAGAAMYLEDDSERLVSIVAKSLRSIEHFLACYGPDGGCDEGVGYWNYGVGHMVLLFHFYLSRTGGKLNLFTDGRAKAMARFPQQVHLFGDTYVNFADCSPHVSMSPGVLAYYAEQAECPSLAELAARQPVWEDRPPGLVAAIRDIFWAGAERSQAPLEHEPDTWFPDLQWLVARYDASDPASLTLAAKAGHNAEKHNHNDGGTFAVYAGEPLVIDMGVGVYTRQTFSTKRYDLLPIRSKGHNVPLVNGTEQAAGSRYAASDVEHVYDGDSSVLRQQMKGFYPPAAGIRSWIRTVSLDRAVDGGAVELVDAFELDEASDDVLLPLYTPGVVVMTGDSLLLKGKSAALRVELDGESVQVEVTTVPLDDDRLRSLWGDNLHCIGIRPNRPVSEGVVRIRFVPERAT